MDQALLPWPCPGVLSQWLCWEATGRSGGLFPVLDADICLATEDAQHTRLGLTGTYRPPLGRLGAGLDKMALGQVAGATVRGCCATSAAPWPALPGADREPAPLEAGHRH